MRFAELGLVGERPELIVSGINHGSNLGDDITYSGHGRRGALEGIVLGIPAIAHPSSPPAGMDSPLGARLRLLRCGCLRRRSWCAASPGPLPADTLLNVNCPARITERESR